MIKQVRLQICVIGLLNLVYLHTTVCKINLMDLNKLNLTAQQLPTLIHFLKYKLTNKISRF